MQSIAGLEAAARPASRRQAWLSGRVLKLCGATAASNLSDGVFQVALAVLAVHLTRSPEAVAGILFAARLPWLLCALHAGLIADRWDRLRILAGANVGRMLLIGALALLTLAHLEHLAVLYVVAFALGVADTLFDTSVHSLLPRVVQPQELERANSYLQSAELITLEFVGPPLGGLLAGVAVWLAFGSSALIYLATALLLLWIGGRFRPAGGAVRRPMGGEIREGLAFLWEHPLLRIFALVGGVLNFAFAAVLAVLPLYAVAPGPMELSSTGYGLLLTGTGIGGLAAALLTTRAQAWLGASRLLLASIVGLGVGCLIPALTAQPLAVGTALVLTGAVVFWNVVTVSIRQRITPDRLLGRVNATNRLFLYGTLPLGAAMGGFVGGALGLQSVFVLAAAVVAAMALPVAYLASPGRLAAAEADGARILASEEYS
jgi:hypothetical protein